MTFKFKIIYKGLTLIAVPLLFGIAFILFLFLGLAESDRRFQHELLVKDAMIASDGINRKLYASKICTISYLASKDKFFQESFSDNMRQSVVLYKHLRDLLKDEPGLQLSVESLKQEMLSCNRRWKMMKLVPIGNMDMHFNSGHFGARGLQMIFSNRQVGSLMEKLQKAAGNETVLAVDSMNRLQMTLTLGIVVSVLLTVVLAIYFGLNVTSRLLKIIDNTIRLSKGLSLSQPVQGTDEIAELDLFLYNSAAQIRELELFKSQLIGVVSHELKSPLSSVEAFLAAFAGGIFGELSKKAQEKIERAHRSVIRLMGLVKELLDLDRLEAGKLEMTLQQVSVTDVINSAVDSVRELSERSGVSIEIKNDADKVIADRDRLVQVIVNLLGNAMKFSPPQGKVTVESRQSEGWFECRVIDQGRGIPESFRKAIFEPFQQIDSKDATTKKGTGLGLTISRSIVEEHGGKIGVDSVEGQGSTFWFKIPASGDFSPAEKSHSVSDCPSESALSKGDSARSDHRSGARPGGRFKVMHKGLILISVPLIFQLTFLSVIGFLLHQVREQIHLEERSKEIVNSLNRMEERLAQASVDGLIYVGTQDPQALKSWIQGKAEAFDLLDRAKRLSAGDATQLENLKQTREWLSQSISVLEGMVNSKESDLSSILVNSGFVQKSKPLESVQTGQESLLEREKGNGERLAQKREIMIRNMETALVAGIVLNIILSSGLSIFLMRSITGRLRHVMENTARLVKRDSLDPPIKGNDEIAYLDQVFFETGKHLVELETFKRELISIVSHELRTPLMAVSTSFELFSAGAFGELSQKAQSRLKVAEGETNRLIRLINNLLDIEKMEAGKFILDIQELKVSQLLETSIKAVEQLALSKQIKLESSFSEGSFSADRDRLAQVIINLLSNAIKFSEPGQTIKIAVSAGDSQIEFRVIDQGRGIPPDLKEKIFERFVQVEKKDASERGGSGLGLAIAMAIVEQHGGTIGVESEPGRGSTFWFKLPAGK